MNLKFLNNPSQRVATGKSLPLKQLEAIVFYGTPEQRAKVVAKVLPQSYVLSLNKATHHILLSILSQCDNLVRANMLYHLRRKINDMARSPCGNVLVQKLLEFLPNAQRKEIAESFVLNVEPEELEELCKHAFGNHVAQALLEYPASADVVLEHLEPLLTRLAVHPMGDRVVAKVIDHVADGASIVVKALFPGGVDDEMSLLDDIMNNMSESHVISALLKHHSVPAEVKDGIIASLIENADKLTSTTPKDSNKKGKDALSYAEPDFISGGNKKKGGASSSRQLAEGSDEADGGAKEATPYKHIFAFVSAIQYGDDVQRKELYDAFLSKMQTFCATKGLVQIPIAFLKYATDAIPQCQTGILASLFPSSAAQPTPSKKGKSSAAAAPSAAATDVVDAAIDSVKTLVLRAALELRLLVDPSHTQPLINAGKELAVSPSGGPVLQRLVEFGDDTNRAALCKKVLPSIADGSFVQDPCASFLVQAFLEHSSGKTRQQIVDAVLESLAGDPHKALATAQGSRVLQKLVAYAPDETVAEFVDAVLEGEEDDEDHAEEQEEEAEEGEAEAAAEGEAVAEESTLTRSQLRAINKKKHYAIRDKRLFSYATHHNACYAVQALLRETKSRQLESHRKRLMNSLKPYVFDLAVSPWAGRLVLDLMLLSGSTELKAAIKNVVFMRAESWLSDVPEGAHGKKMGSMTPTMKRALNGNRGQESDRKRPRSDSASSRPASSAGGEAKKPNKKVFRSFKK